MEKLEGKLFIPSHAPASAEIGSLIKADREKVYEIAELLKRFVMSLWEGRYSEGGFDNYHLMMDENQYVLVGSTIRSYLSWLKAQGRVRGCFYR